MEPLERRLEILKWLQGKEKRTVEIAEHFGVDERTIRNDLQDLRDGMDIFGVKIKIESKHYDGNPKQYYKSTVHPVMLALNSSELFALLKLLEEAAGNQNTGGVYQHIFDAVYSQLTDYGENLIANKLKGTYNKSQITNRLEEEAFTNCIDYKLVYWEKSGRPIEISYVNGAGETVKEEARLVDIRGNVLELKDKNNHSRWVNYGDILVDWSAVDYR